jgi:hypothetical protein
VDVTTRERGIVVSIVPLWHPAGERGSSRRLRLLVEYDTDDGPAVTRAVTSNRPDIRVGSDVTVLVRRNGRARVLLDQYQPPPPWWAKGQPVSGILAYLGLVVLMLLIAGGIWIWVMQRRGEILRELPFMTPTPTSIRPSGSATPSPTPSTSVAPSDASITPTAQPGTT